MACSRRSKIRWQAKRGKIDEEEAGTRAGRAWCRALSLTLRCLSDLFPRFRGFLSTYDYLLIPTQHVTCRHNTYFEEEDGLINFSKIIERIDQLKFCYVSRVIQFYTFSIAKQSCDITYKCNDHASSILWKKHWKWYYKIK